MQRESTQVPVQSAHDIFFYLLRIIIKGTLYREALKQLVQVLYQDCVERYVLLMKPKNTCW